MKKYKKAQKAYAEKGAVALYQESVVSEDLPPFAVAAGNPPQVVRMMTEST